MESDIKKIIGIILMLIGITGVISFIYSEVYEFYYQPIAGFSVFLAGYYLFSGEW